MKEKKNYSLLVASIFFILFLVFVISFNDSITGNAVLNMAEITPNTPFADNVSGTVTLNLSSGYFIPNTSNARLQLIYDNEILRESKFDINSFFSMTTPKLSSSDLVKVNNNYGYNKTGLYSINLGTFGLNVKPYYDKLNIKLKIENNSEIIVDEETEINVANKSSSHVAIYDFVELGSVNFELKKGQMVVKSASSNFQSGDYIWCLVRFYNTTLKSKGGSLDVSFYDSANKLDASFLDVTNKKANVSEDDEGGLCDDTDPSVCGAFYKVNSKEYGHWSCKVVANPGNVSVYSDNVFFSKEFLMVNAGPTLVKDIPDMNVSKNGTYDTIDLDDYFDSPIGGIQYAISGLKYLDAHFDKSNKLFFSNPYNFEGVENVSIRASDGYKITESNKFLIRVGTGNFVPSTSCVADSRTTSWSACVNGVQTRSVVDVNSCSVETGKPVDSQVCVEDLSEMTTGQKYTTTYTSGTVKKNLLILLFGLFLLWGCVSLLVLVFTI